MNALRGEMRHLFAAEALRELVCAQVQHGGAAVRAGLRGITGLELVDQVTHLLRRQRLAGTHGSVAGQRRSDSAVRVGRRVLAGDEIEQLDESARRVLTSQAGGCRTQQVAAAAERLDLEAMLP